MSMTYDKAMEVLGVSYSTLKRYVVQGKIRTYDYKIKKYLGKKNYWDEDVYALVGKKRKSDKGLREVAAYFRVNEPTKEGQARMQKQKELVNNFCGARGISIDRVYEDYGSSIFSSIDKRPSYHKLLQDIMLGNVALVVIETRCRLSRFAYSELEEILKYYQVDILVINRVIDDLFYQDEQADDIARMLKKSKLERSVDISKKGRVIQAQPERDMGLGGESQKTEES